MGLATTKTCDSPCSQKSKLVCASRGFVHSCKTEEKKLQPASRADKNTIIRRLYFDLVGIPPSPEQIHSYLNDHAANATEIVVDQLLASPQFGERWARHWLDLMRYAESRGT